MGRIYSQKLRCLSSVVKQKEDWQGIIFGSAKRAELIDEILKKSEGIEAEDGLIDEGDSEDEQEESDK
jgi:hypothetical protein